MNMSHLIAAPLVALALLGTSAAFADPMPLEAKDDAGNALTGDPTHGETVFHKCSVCHSIKLGENRVGPSLHGVVGRPAGTVDGYGYSNANKTSGITWTQQEIFVYLQNPQKKVPGTKMSFAGLASPQDRADVIAYLISASK